ncbi:hypothetical protein FQN60_018602, partial [Etheostoma spectabile]
MPEPIRVVVTGAAGQIAYSLLYSIAKGDVFGKDQVAMRCGVSSDKVKNVIIWGNHSSTQYPDVHHAKVNVHGSETPAYDANKTWKMVDGLPVNDFSRAKMDATAAELVEERDTAMDF